MSTQYRPITAITMGDPAGIGPEIVVGTMLSEEIHDCCRPFVIGTVAAFTVRGIGYRNARF